VAARKLKLAVDGDAIVVEEADELAELLVARERRRLVRDAFLQAAVAGDEPRVVVDHLVAFAIEQRGRMRLGYRHADRIGEALAERAGGGLDAGGVSVLGVARRAA